ncbi:MAG: hypothetical protein II748_05915 [Clostridia bacterium]|nr:hypothetical protein [Clostridia bacterium]
MKILTFGEILWDVFPQKKEIGGAAFNFAAHVAKLGADSYMISKVGYDDMGRESLECADKLGVKRDFIIVENVPTGYCKVTIDDAGIPTYNLVKGVSYDNLTVTKEMKKRLLGEEFDAFYFGTLPQRGEITKKTLEDVLSYVKTKEIICDVNIRQKWYSKETVENCAKYSTILKISEEECRVFEELGLVDRIEGNYREELCRRLADKYDIRYVILTLGKYGAMVYVRSEDKFYVSRVPQGKPVSTVGAGDSFSACFVYNLVNGAAVEDCLERAVTLSDYVVTKIGAVPDYEPGLLEKCR